MILLVLLLIMMPSMLHMMVVMIIVVVVMVVGFGPVRPRPSRFSPKGSRMTPPRAFLTINCLGKCGWPGAMSWLTPTCAP